MSDDYPTLGMTIKENVFPHSLKGYALADDFFERLRIFVEEAYSMGALCVIDGLDTYSGNEKALTWLFDLPGSLVLTLQGVGRFSSQPYLDALVHATNLIKL